MGRLLQHLDLTEEQKKMMEEVMTNGSRALLYCSQVFFDNDDRKSRLHFLEMLNSGMIDEMIEEDLLEIGPDCDINQEHLDAIEAVKSIQVMVLQGYGKSIASVIKYFRQSSYKDVIQAEKFYDEAQDAAINAMYFYDSSYGVVFHTFLYRFVKNALRDLTKKFNTKNKRHVCIAESQIKETQSSKSFLETLPKSTSLYSDEEVSMLYKAIKMAKLNPLQRELLEGFMAESFDKHKNVTINKLNIRNVVENHINPKTGKPYCAYQGCLELRRAQEIVCNTYRLLMFQAA